MKKSNRSNFGILSWARLLVVGMLLASGSAGMAHAALDCGSSPCPGTLPAIWPHPSATLDGFVRILGWNLEPAADYDVVLMGPDGALLFNGSVTTDVEGGILGRFDGLNGQPYLCAPSGAGGIGVYQVLLYRSPWRNSADEAPVAVTSFYHN